MELELSNQFYSTQVSEEQLWTLLKKMRNSKDMRGKAFWNEISELLNAEGPCVKSGKEWRGVNKE